jgi:cell pole-organizing protein PopZ
MTSQLRADLLEMTSQLEVRLQRQLQDQQQQHLLQQQRQMEQFQTLLNNGRAVTRATMSPAMTPVLALTHPGPHSLSLAETLAEATQAVAALPAVPTLTLAQTLAQAQEDAAKKEAEAEHHAQLEALAAVLKSNPAVFVKSNPFHVQALALNKKRKEVSSSRSTSPDPRGRHTSSCECVSCRVHYEEVGRARRGTKTHTLISALHSPIPDLLDDSSQDSQASDDEAHASSSGYKHRLSTHQPLASHTHIHPLLHGTRSLKTVQVEAYGGPLLQREMYWDEFTSLAPIDQLKSMLAARATLLNSLMDQRPPPFGLLLPPSGDDYSSDRELQKALKKGQRCWMFNHTIRDMSCWTD